MKRKVSFLILFICLLFGYCYDVQAMEMNTTDIPNNTYVIGKHMFTDEVVLSTKYIMLGSTTIESDKLSDMIIYYKTPRGTWIDGLSGENVNVPQYLNVEYINVEYINIDNPTPTISSVDEISNTKDGRGKIYNLLLTDIENMTGVEIYFSLTENGKYELANNYKVININENKIKVEVQGGYNYFYKVRTYKTIANEKLYSEYSNIVNIDNRLLQPGSSLGSDIYIPKTEENSNLSMALLFDLTTFKTALGNNPDGIEVYSSLTENSNYQLVSDITYNDLDIIDQNNTIQIPFDCKPGSKNYFKIRSYIKYDADTIIYSDYVNAVYEHTLLAPNIDELKLLNQNSDNLTYGVDIYISNFNPSNDFHNYSGGIDVLYSTEKNGNYSLLSSVSLDNIDNISDENYKININIPLGEKYFIKLRKYVVINSQKIVSNNYSNIKETEKYTITYNLNDGEFYTQEGKNNFEIFTPNDEFEIAYSKKSGCIFLGWTGSNGEIPEKDIKILKGTTGNLEYTANWGLLGDLNLDGNIDELDKIDMIKYLEDNVANNLKLFEIADLDQDNVVDDVDLEILDRYLKNEIQSLPYESGEKYNITYNLDGGSFDEYPRNIYATKLLNLETPFKIPNPTKEGYTFLGWIVGNGTAPFTDLTIFGMETGDLEYTACWIAKDSDFILRYNFAGVGNDEGLHYMLKIYDGLKSFDQITDFEVYVKYDEQDFVKISDTIDYYSQEFHKFFVLKPKGVNVVEIKLRPYLMDNDNNKIYYEYTNSLSSSEF